MRTLTEKQRSILEFIEEFSASEGMAPTVYEIGERFNIKSSTVFAHLKALQRKKELERSSKARSIVLHGESKQVRHTSFLVAIPLLGRINAGVTTESLEFKEGDVYVSSNLTGKYPESDFFALRIQGESMRDLGILEGDIVIVKQTNTAKNGEVVVALANNETTIKSFYPTNDGKVELRPANREFAPQFYTTNEVAIQGVVVALQREF